MSVADLVTAGGHLDVALRHLETAHALVSQGDIFEELDAHERFQLNGTAAEAGVLIDRITRTIGGRNLANELAALADPGEVDRYR